MSVNQFDKTPIRFLIRGLLKQGDISAKLATKGIRDTSANNYFIDNHVAEKNNFVPNAKCDVFFATLNGHVFQVSNYYDLNLIITNNHGQTRDFK